MESIVILKYIPQIVFFIRSLFVTTGMTVLRNWKIASLIECMVFILLLISLYTLLKHRKGAFIMYYALFPMRFLLSIPSFFGLGLLRKALLFYPNELLDHILFSFVCLMELARLIYVIYVHKLFLKNGNQLRRNNFNRKKNSLVRLSRNEG